MEGETEPIQGAGADPEGGGPDPQPKSALPASTEPVPVTGVTNPSFLEDPPPYSPPDPKTAHLLYLTFQTNVPGEWDNEPRAFVFQHSSSCFTEIPLEAEQRQPPPKDYMVESFLVMAFCCLVTGVFALIYSNEVRSAVARGDLAQASMFSQKARSFVLYSLAFGLFTSACWVIYVLVFLYL